MDRWVCDLTIAAAAGDITQLYPDYAGTGINPASATVGQQLRMPCEGQLIALQIKTDGSNGGYLEVFDISGYELGVDVSSAAAITNAVLVAALTAGKARLIFDQNFAGSGLTPFTPIGPAGFVKGLAARATGITGTVSLNLTVHGGYRFTTRG